MYEHDAEDDLDDSEHPDEPDDDDSDETVPCPYCREPVYEDAERCPSCGSYLSEIDAPRRHPWWFLLGFVLSMLVILWWVFFCF